jgi:putative MATE family efflux protein
MKTDDDLTQGSIIQHLVRLSIPASMGMVFNTLYNLTDLWFAGGISDAALAGMSIAGSVFFLLIGIGAGVQTGTSAMVASDVGRKRSDLVQGWVDHAFGIAIAASVIAVLAGWLAGDPLIALLGAEADSAPLARAYLSVTLLGTVFFLLTSVAAGALIALGDTKSNRNALAAGLIANFALNPLLIYGFDFGVAGLAGATVIIKAATALFLFYVLRKRLGQWSKPRFAADAWRRLLGQILPASFNMLTIILGSFITIYFIGRFGDNRVAGYNVGLRLEQVLLLPALGMNAAVMAVAGQNFGAGQPERVRETYLSAIKLGLAMAAVFIPVMVFGAPTLVRFFSDDPVIVETGSTYLRIDAIAYFAYTVLFLSVAVLQAQQRPLFPMVLGIGRQLVVPALINFVLIVWLGMPMISIFITLVCVVVLAAALSHWWTMKQLSGAIKAPANSPRT